MTTLNNPSQKQAENIKTLTLLPTDYKNELFEQNLAFFRKHQPNLFNAVVNHTCQEYRLCSNPDGSPNIIAMQSKQPVSPSYTMNDIMDAIHKNIDMLFCNLQVGNSFLGDAAESYKINNPIQWDMQKRLFEVGIFSKLKLSPDYLTPLQSFRADYFPLVRVYGIGLGYHLTEMIKVKRISYMTIYEPCIDLFYTSLFTIPWNLIFKYFESKGKGVNLVIGLDPDDAITSNMAFIGQRLMPLTSCFYRYKHFNHEKITELISKEPQSDAVERSQTDAGWYEDQRAGFFLSARNIKKGNKFFSGKKTKRFFRAFIVGSGPSLNETINYIKTHQNNAIIISCGTAFTPLYKAGIIPDYEIVQERDWQYVKFEEKHDLDLFKEVTLLKLNVVSTKIDKYYKETLVFQKFRDPGSSLLGGNYPVTTGVNPTVTNAGIAMCIDLGVNEVYLFGIDYGAPKNSPKMHATNTLYSNKSLDDSVASKTNFEVPGNLGSVIRTDTVLSWSRQTTELKIAESPDIQWFNVGEGARISGAKPMKVNDFPQKFKNIQKDQLCKEISSLFNSRYNSNDVFERLNTTQMSQTKEYLQAIKCFKDSKPQTREEIILVLTHLYQAVCTGQNMSNFLPTSLLSYGFKQFVTNVYIQSSLTQEENSAAQFFEASKQILNDYIDDIENDLASLLSYIELDQETDLQKVHGGVIFEKITS